MFDERKVLEELKVLLAQVLAVNATKINDSSSMENLLEWDSLSFLSVVVAVEKKYGFKLSPAEMERARTLRSLVAIIKDRA